MPEYKLTIAYDGTDFAGWQKQEPPAPTSQRGSQDDAPVHPAVESRKLDPSLVASKPGRIALRTVQAVVERAVQQVVREPIRIQGASRTDAGVHAHGQVAVFSCSDKAWPIERGLDTLTRAVNSRLPADVLLRAIEPVEPGFNPIGDCVSKGYVYTIWSGLHRPLRARGRVFHTWAELDLEAMQRAAAALIGEHDFASFAAIAHGRQTTVRTIHTCCVFDVTQYALYCELASHKPAGCNEECPTAPQLRTPHAYTIDTHPARVYEIHVSGNGFLYNMVRIIAGTLHEVGRGKITPDAMAEILARCDRRAAGPTLPAHGLCLDWIRYA